MQCSFSTSAHRPSIFFLGIIIMVRKVNLTSEVNYSYISYYISKLNAADGRKCVGSYRKSKNDVVERFVTGLSRILAWRRQTEDHNKWSWWCIWCCRVVCRIIVNYINIFLHVIIKIASTAWCRMIIWHMLHASFCSDVYFPSAVAWAPLWQSHLDLLLIWSRIYI